MITPLEQFPELAEALSLPDVYLKREDLHPYGSHKGRSIPVMIEHYEKAGDRHFAVTGSGNAALAAALYIKEENAAHAEKDAAKQLSPLQLDVFVGNHVSPAKLAKLRKLCDDNIRVTIKERPLQALSVAIDEGIRSLRQSTDDEALIGYESLGEELLESAKKIKSSEGAGMGAVFIGTSSGTTAQALTSYFISKKSPIQVHIVQTSSCHPIADGMESYDGPSDISIADAIVDKTALRKGSLIPLIKKTGGKAWVATNDDIRAAQELVFEHTGLEISTNSALSIVGAMKAAYTGHSFTGAVVCLICGD